VDAETHNIHLEKAAGITYLYVPIISNKVYKKRPSFKKCDCKPAHRKLLVSGE
jgi:hypothetical protein